MTERDLFEAIRGLPPEGRTAYLEAACQGDAPLRQRLRALLNKHDRASRFLEDPVFPTPPLADAPTCPAPLPESPGLVLAGRYKLVEEIGEGGMGSVWMAQQTEPVKRLVAVKLIKAGMDTHQVTARFEAERQALALMDHPNIARVFDAGSTEAGRPYFVMELVKGVPITRFCDESKLTPRQRLGLFADVCQAIQHAHQKGIIHRDLKPSNVLVAPYDGKPVVKVIDFGVAKAAGQPLTDLTLVTGFGAVVGTPEYMSPEQAELNNQDVDTRSDVYSLGGLLYELLTGTTPLNRKRTGGAILDALRAIREEEPQRPSARLTTTQELATIAANRGLEPAKLSRMVRGELDWIVMRCLEKERSRRYETASALAADVGRYLSDEPVLACPPSTVYRLRKVVRRHKGGLLAVTLVFLALVGGILGATIGLVRAARAARAESDQRKAAERERENAIASLRTARRAINQMLTRVAQEHLAHTPQMEQIQRDVLRDALGFYRELLAAHRDDPALKRESALVTGWLGAAYRRLGQNDQAEAALREAIQALEGLLADGGLDREGRDELTRFCMHLGWLLGRLNRTADAVAVRARAVELAEQLVSEFPETPRYSSLLASCCIDLGNAYRRSNLREAERLFRRSLALSAVKTGNRHDRGRASLALGDMLLSQKRWGEADEALQAAETTFAQLTRDSPRLRQIWERLADVHALRGRLLVATGRPAEAAAAYGRAVTVLRKLRADYPASAYARIALTKVRDDVRAALKEGAKGHAELQRVMRDVEELLRLTRGASEPTRRPD